MSDIEALKGLLKYQYQLSKGLRVDGIAVADVEEIALERMPQRERPGLLFSNTVLLGEQSGIP